MACETCEQLRKAAEEALAWFRQNYRSLHPPTDKSDIAWRMLRDALALDAGRAEEPSERPRESVP
jgi:hypothetical protein